jgi:REG-2-like HAD superfamily hydrolase
MPLRALLVDAGDTLLRERPPRFEIYAEVARSRGRNVTAQTMQRVMRTAHDDIPRKVRGAFRYSDPWFRAFIHRIFCQNLGLPVAEIAAITDELFARFEDPATFEVFPGARELLADLRARDVRLAVVSNWSARLPRLLEALELSPLFDAVLCSAIEELEKPDPALFALALERLGVPAAEALHVGDHPVKDGAAREVGIEFVLMDHAGRHPEPDSPRAGSFAELSALLASRRAS